MSKRINNIYDDALTFSKIRDAYIRTSKRKKKTADTIKFGMYLEDNIIDIYKKLKNETYEVGKYQSFKVKEPKERVIYCLPFYDRVVQQLYVYEYIMPYMIPKFISTSFACIPKRGLHKCIDTLQKYMRSAVKQWKNPYFVKYDISKFFYTIDRKIMYEIMTKYYKDKKFLRLTKKFIDFVDENEYGKDKGLPIGNYTSQYFANIYMNEVDKYIKEKLRIKYYIRFMDDGILIVENKEKAKEILEKIRIFLDEKLKLKLNRKTCYMPVKKGCIYCGYRVYLNYKLIKRANIVRVKRRIKGWNKSWKKGEYDFNKWKQSFYAWRGYAKHANSYYLIKKLEKMQEYKIKGGKKMKVIDKIALVLIIIGAINWGLIGLFKFNLVELIFGDMTILARIIYTLVGISGLWGIKLLFED